MKTEKDDDSTFRTGAAFVAVGFILIAAIWYLFLRPQQEQFQPPPVVPIDTAVTNTTIYELTSGESHVQFSIDELLRGQPKTVVGITQLVSGQIALNPADLSTAQVGVIQANTLSFYTDDAFRDEALHSFIIDSPAYPLVIFAPTQIEGLPAQIAVGETAVFTLTGNLTLRDITQPVTFDCTAVLTSPTRLEGRATATISRTAFNLRIPEVAQVANVADEFLIEIAFVATAVE
ncbi:MAG: YceI family protein [Ardenticatenaceae bacterium]|nr:YceI family protein [Ardenticatenaceae bacterium]